MSETEQAEKANDEENAEAVEAEAEAEEQTEGDENPFNDAEWLQEQLDEAESQSALAEEHDVTPSTISYYVKKHGLETTSRQTYEGTEVDDPEFLREKYHDEGMSMQQIGDEVGCSDGTVMRYMRKHDIEPRAQRAGSSEPGPFHIVESVNGVGPAKIGALEERGLEGDDDVLELVEEAGIVSDAGDEDAEPGLAETHGWSESLAERVNDQLAAGEPASDDDEESEE